LYIEFIPPGQAAKPGSENQTDLSSSKGEKQMNAKGKNSPKENKMKITASTLMRLAGISAMVTGLCFLVIGTLHPVNEPSAVTTAAWLYAHIAATALGFFGLFGMAGLYARQAEKAGWLGLIGFILFSFWMTMVSGFSLFEAFILPKLASTSPAYVQGFLGMFSGASSEIDLGILPTLWKISEPMYILGPLLFGIATFRAGVLPRWAGALFVAGATLGPVGALLVAPEFQPLVMVPNGLALAWLGYALFSERREKTSEAVREQRTARPEPSQVA
jgi:hypothetical protein